MTNLLRTCRFSQRYRHFRVAKGLSQGLTGIAIDGGPQGEMALHYNANGGTMVLGDALINFEPHGFGFLPAKYCRNARLMRRSLRKLLDYAFDRMFFAHGTPILSGARARVERLLGYLPLASDSMADRRHNVAATEYHHAVSSADPFLAHHLCPSLCLGGASRGGKRPPDLADLLLGARLHGPGAHGRDAL